MRVKIPFNGKFFYSKKRHLWFKGTITKIVYTDGIPTYVETSLRSGNGYNDMGRWVSLSDNVDYIYKQL